MRTLQTKLALLKQDLRSKSEKLNHVKGMSEQKRINNRLFKSPKQLYRSTSLLKNWQKRKRLKSFGKMFGKTKQVLMIKQNGYNNLKKFIVET